MIKLAKRDNNKKRSFLLVNKSLCKHIAERPSRCLEKFDELGEMLAKRYNNENVLCIGFAETATALGIRVASHLKGYYISTTREDIDAVDWFDFKEEHSHATEQKLSETDVAGVVDIVDRIVFIDDEITTGNTVMNIIKLLKKKYPTKKLKYSVVSLINNMSDEALASTDVEFVFLTNEYRGIDFDKKLKEIMYNPEENTGNYIDITANHIELNLTNTKTEMLDARRLVTIKDYTESCEVALQDALSIMKLKKDDSVLVVGTEEFMYPAIYIGNALEDKVTKVRCKSTTRSPILADRSADYPIHTRYKLRSLYDSERTTYIYDLKQYDRVLIISDGTERKGLNDLVAALRAAGNEDIYYIKVDKVN